MDHVNYIKKIFESVEDFRKNVLILFFLNDKEFLTDCGFLKNDFDSVNKEFGFFLIEQMEDYLEYIKNEEECSNKRILNK